MSGSDFLKPVPVDVSVNKCVAFVRECEREFELEKIQRPYHFRVSLPLAEELMRTFDKETTDVVGRIVFNRKDILMGHPCVITGDEITEHPISLVFTERKQENG